MTLMLGAIAGSGLIAHRAGFSVGRLSIDSSAALAGAVLLTLPGVYLSLAATVTNATGTSGRSFKPAIALLIGGAALGGLGGLTSADALQGKGWGPALAVLLALGGIALGGGLGLLALLLSQNTWAEMPTLLLIPIAVAVTSVAAYALFKPARL